MVFAHYAKKKKKKAESLNHLLITCDLVINVWFTIDTRCPTPINSSLMITDWIELIWAH